jgi:hypothetical protein
VNARCSQCRQPITGRVVHDQDVPWCVPCRRAELEHQAFLRAERLLRGDLEFARLVAEIQRVPEKAVA